MASEQPAVPAYASGSQHSSGQSNGIKRNAPLSIVEADTNYVNVPSNDHNSWYFPCHGYDSDENDRVSVTQGNWGRKSARNARWIRRGKMTAWGPGMDDWEGEEHARLRLRDMLPAARSRSPSPPSLPHLRSPSPPLTAPYPPPVTQHLSYTSFVMDKGVTHSFRSTLLEDLEQATNNLIEGEGTMRRALGRLWQVMSEDPDRQFDSASVVLKREPQDEGEAGESDSLDQRLANVPDLTPPVHKIFLVSYANGVPPVSDPSGFADPDSQMQSLEKSLANLRELLDDGREYIERLEEIREGLGEIRNQRSSVWDMVRENAIKELQEAAMSTAGQRR